MKSTPNSFWQSVSVYPKSPISNGVTQVAPKDQIGGSMEYSETEKEFTAENLQNYAENKYDPAIERLIMHGPVTIEIAQPQNIEKQPEFDTPLPTSLQAAEIMRAAEAVIDSARTERIEIGGQTEIAFRTVLAEEVTEVSSDKVVSRETFAKFDYRVETQEPETKGGDKLAAVESFAAKALWGFRLLGKLGEALGSAGKGIIETARVSPPKVKKEQKPEDAEKKFAARQWAGNLEQDLKKAQAETEQKALENAGGDEIAGLNKTVINLKRGLQAGVNRKLTPAEAVQLRTQLQREKDAQKKKGQEARSRAVKAATKKPSDNATDFENRKLSGNVG